MAGIILSTAIARLTQAKPYMINPAHATPVSPAIEIRG
jgi:hypothetical protein